MLQGSRSQDRKFSSNWYVHFVPPSQQKQSTQALWFLPGDMQSRNHCDGFTRLHRYYCTKKGALHKENHTLLYFPSYRKSATSCPTLGICDSDGYNFGQYPMKALIYRIQRIRFTEKSAPFALLAAMLLAFGLMIPWLGFYQDDWHHVYYAYARGVGSLWELLNYDGRPFAAWVYVLGFSVLGFKPIAWQISTLLLRWLTVSFIWGIFEQIWPGRTRQNFTAALLFAIYPFFTIQPLSVAYAIHWTGYLFYALSIWLMLRAAKEPQRLALFTTLALLSEAIHLFTLEYFAGIELLRPILLWFVLSDENGRKKAGQVVRRWLPYLIIFLIYFAWRGFIYHSPVATRNAPQGLISLLSSPLQTAQFVLVNIIPDLVLILVSTWFDILSPESVDFKSTINILFMMLALFSAALTYFYLWRNKNSEADPDRRWKWQALILGIATILLGLLPAYSANYVMHSKLPPWNERFSLGSLFGAGLLITLVLEGLIASSKARRVVLALLVGLTIGLHARSTNIFRHAWEAETDFYRQLTLRAPSIAPNTAFISNDEFLGMMGDYPTSFALNTIYAEPKGVAGSKAITWLFLVNTNFGGRPDGLLSGMSFLEEKQSTRFDGNSKNSLVITYEPELNQCLWVITPENADAQVVPEVLRFISPLSNTRLIETSASPSPFLQTILPSQPDSWCTTYQRGSLAHQIKDWDKAVALWEEAAKEGLRPANGFEYLPFIEAYGQSTKWPQAYELTRAANKLSRSMENALCSLWARLEVETPSSSERENNVVKVKEYLGCK
jgi:hypothetical protein